MTERHRVRVVLECEVEIRDINMATVLAEEEVSFQRRLAQGWFPPIPRVLPSEQEVEDARALQESLRANPWSLKEWVLLEVARELECNGIEAASRPEGEDYRILKPVVESLPSPQRERLHDALAEDRLWEMADQFYMSFHVTIRSMATAEVPRLRLVR